MKIKYIIWVELTFLVPSNESKINTGLGKLWAAKH